MSLLFINSIKPVDVLLTREDGHLRAALVLPLPPKIVLRYCAFFQLTLRFNPFLLDPMICLSLHPVTQVVDLCSIDTFSFAINHPNTFGALNSLIGQKQTVKKQKLPSMSE